MAERASGFAERLVAEIIRIEGDYVDHPSDRGGPTMYGITEAVARENGYTGPMRELPRWLAESIYRHRYIIGPGFDLVAEISEPIAAELADTGVNMGTGIARVLLQRWLAALNRRGRDYPDIVADGDIGPKTLAALRAFLAVRAPHGERHLLVALNCSQGHGYLERAERRELNEDFLNGWIAARVADQL